MPARILVVDDSATIRRVVTAILERNGFEVESAPDGLAALEMLTGEPKPTIDLILLDFVMPKMNGYQFCRELRRKDGLAALPVVLMSAKSDKIRDSFVQQTGAIDAISKPFDAQALVAVIENALRRVHAGRASATRVPEAEEEPVDSERATSPGDERMKRARIAAEVAVHLGGALAPMLGDVRPQARGADEIVRLLAERLDAGVLRACALAIRDVDLDDGPRPVLSGDLAVIPVGAVLQLLQVEGQSGVLTVANAHRSSEVTVTLRGGLIDLAQSRGTEDEFRLGRYFVEEGLVTPQELEQLLVKRVPANDAAPAAAASEPTVRVPAEESKALLVQSQENAERSSPIAAPAAAVPSERTDPEGVPTATEPQRPLGDRLLAAGRVDEEQLRGALIRQSSELVYEMLRWQKGRFEFRRAPAASMAAAAKLGLTVPAVVMEGFRRVDEWRALERTVSDFDEVLVRDELALDALPKEKLAKPEHLVLGAIDGRRSIREVIAATHMSSFDACRVLVQLLAARLVRRVA